MRRDSPREIDIFIVEIAEGQFTKSQFAKNKKTNLPNLFNEYTHLKKTNLVLKSLKRLLNYS